MQNLVLHHPKLFLLQNAQRSRKSQFKHIYAKKSNSGENSRTKSSLFSFKISKAFVAKSAAVIFGLGFIDAGYSGDWSRIGAITKETEEILKVAAYIVFPLCLLLAASISASDES